MTLLTSRSHRDRLAVVKVGFVVAGILSFIFSVYLWFFADRSEAIFVGIWVPSMWSLGALLLAGEARQ